MRFVTLMITAGALAACSAVGGVPLDPRDTTTCVDNGVEITSSGESERLDLIRCAPQSQPLQGS